MCSHLRGERWARVSSDTAWLRGRIPISGSSCIGNDVDFRIILYWTILRDCPLDKVYGIWHTTGRGNAMNLIETTKKFGNQESCVNYLEALRWPDGLQCLKCDSPRVSRI